MRRKVVITGLGVISPVGNTVKEFWDAVLSGKSGVDFITRFDPEPFTTKFAAEVKNFDPLQYMEKREARRMDLFTQYAVAAAQQAVDDAGLNPEKEDLDRIGVVLGTGIGGMEVYHNETINFMNNGPRKVSPHFIPMLIPDIAPGYISIRFGFKGPNYSTVSACASSAHSISTALRLIRYGDADVMVTGGTESTITYLCIAGFNALRALSTRNEAPQKASRPFDLNRDGFVVGEGCGVIILEAEEHALARGAKIYAELAGAGASGDAYHITAPEPGGSGAIRSMQAALKDAGVSPEEVDYINAHGTSTPYNDVMETKAIKAVFGEHAKSLNISSTKSMIGHLLGASGAVEGVATILSVAENKIHPTINYETPDPECDLNYTPNKMVEREVRVALSNSFGFGGHNGTLLIKKYQTP